MKERLKRLNLSDDLLLEIEKILLSLQDEGTRENLLTLLEKTALQHYIREFMKQNMNR